MVLPECAPLKLQQGSTEVPVVSIHGPRLRHREFATTQICRPVLKNTLEQPKFQHAEFSDISTDLMIVNAFHGKNFVGESEIPTLQMFVRRTDIGVWENVREKWPVLSHE